MATELPSDVATALDRVQAVDARAAEVLRQALTRVLRAADGLVWARDRVGALASAPLEADRLEVLVAEARRLTDAPEVWALTWNDAGPTSQIRALAGGPQAARTADGHWVVPAEISRSVLGIVAAERRPLWSDDAHADARFLGAESVQAMSLRSVGCLPLGPRGVLYVHDPRGPGRFSPRARARLAALCATAAELLPPVSASAPVPPPPVEGLIGEAPAMQAVYTAVRAFSPMPWPVLILGETGTGKEAVARAIHRQSGRDGRFVPLNCATVGVELAEATLFGHERGAFTGADRARDGLVAQASHGTLFLDEVGELPEAVQSKLLRLLQEGTYRRVGDVRERRFEGRIVAATHQPVDAPDSAFRADLYHRLSACVVRVPPLRDRPRDVPVLVAHLLERALREIDGAPPLIVSPDLVADLARRSWPGNVRELDNVLKRGVAHALAAGRRTITASDVGEPVPRTGPEAPWPADLQVATEQFQQRQVKRALHAEEGNKTRAAKRLGVTRQWLHRLMAKWDREGPW